MSILLVGVLPISAYVVPCYHHSPSPPEHVIHWPFMGVWWGHRGPDLPQEIIKDINLRVDGLEPRSDLDSDHADQAIYYQQWFVRAAARAFTRQHGLPITPIYASREICRRQYEEGDRAVVYATLAA